MGYTVRVVNAALTTIREIVPFTTLSGNPDQIGHPPQEKKKTRFLVGGFKPRGCSPAA
jgi:hypothetical protein